MRISTVFAIVGLSFLVIAGITPSLYAASPAQAVPFTLETVATGFHRPLYLTGAGDGSGRLFVVEQSGKVKIIQDGTVLPEPFLDVSSWISRAALGGDYTERGLLGLAFAPDYATSGEFYINYTDQNGGSVLARLTVSTDDPNHADPASAIQLLYVDQPYPNHNGGHMAFGPDGMLYVSFGDGGSGGDPQGNGQNLGTLLGKILRLNVSDQDLYAIPDNNPFAASGEGRPEIWAWGLRNVWRFSFDRTDGDLYLADVGQNQWEEINYQPAGSPGGENYGWNAYEANSAYSGSAPASEVVMPVLTYQHRNGWCSVTGGYVYRGQAIPALQGYYLYGDWCTGTIWAANADAARLSATWAWESTILFESGRQISSFGEDDEGELYLVDYNGEVLRFAPAG